MGLKVLLTLLALVAFSHAAPASTNDVTRASSYYNFLQYYMPIVPSDEFLFKNGIKLAALPPCGSAPAREFCQQQFASRLGKTVDIFNDPLQFSQLIASFYRLQPNNGILNLCSAQIEFRNCMNVWYTSCTDAFNIFRDEINDINKAFILAGVYDDIEFDCGGGLEQVLANWNCIVKVNNADGYNDKILACFNTYNQTISKDPTYQNYCPAGDDLSLCIAQAYKDLDTCANYAVQWWACERAARRSRLEGFCSDNPCAAVFPPPATKKPRSLSWDDEYMEFVNSDKFFSPGQLKFFKLAGKTREQKAIILAQERKMKEQ